MPPPNPSWVFPGEIVTSRMGGSVFGSATRWAIESITHRGNQGIHVRVIPIDHDGQAGWFPLDFFLRNFRGSAADTPPAPNLEADLLAGAYGGLLNITEDDGHSQNVIVQNRHAFAVQVGGVDLPAHGGRTFRIPGWRHGTITNQLNDGEFHRISFNGSVEREMEVRSQTINGRHQFIVYDEPDEEGIDFERSDRSQIMGVLNDDGTVVEERQVTTDTFVSEITVTIPSPTTKPSAEVQPPARRRSQWDRLRDDDLSPLLAEGPPNAREVVNENDPHDQHEQDGEGIIHRV